MYSSNIERVPLVVEKVAPRPSRALPLRKAKCDGCEFWRLTGGETSQHPDARESSSGMSVRELPRVEACMTILFPCPNVLSCVAGIGSDHWV